MAMDRVAIVQARLDAYLAGARPAASPRDPEAPLRPGSDLTARKALALFEDQLLSRSIDVAARRLRRRDLGFYTISSAGHEQNAVLGARLRLSDPCLLHYRSGAFMMARARVARGGAGGGGTPLFDTLLGLSASREDPVCQGRHKVWGGRALNVIPQTSTIASHLPKAVGLAFALGRARRLGIDAGAPADALVFCSFGDASINHASALSGINAARYAHRRGHPVPILFFCEDNGLGISVSSPSRWIPEAFQNLEHLRYFEAGASLDEVWDAAGRAIAQCRKTRGPVLLRLDCVRLWGHAGSDIESAYRTAAEIEATEKRDPLLANARLLVETGAAAPEELAAVVASIRARAAAAAEEAATRPKLATLEEIARPIAPYDSQRCRAAAKARPSQKPASAPARRTLAALINAALADEMARREEMILFGEDVGRKGGVYYVTGGLQKRFGPARVFDTLLDETTILGVAQGAALAGLLPVPEIQYLAYLHNAIDQLRGEACTLAFFSGGAFSNPMVVRIAAFAYQKGFGGHFHNDNAIGALREIPGLVLAAPSRGDDAARMLRGCLAIAKECGRVVCFLEPIALYHEKDLHEEGDGLWLCDYPPPGDVLLPGEAGGEGEGPVLLVSYANGYRKCLQAARLLEQEEGLAVRVMDLRWLNPLPYKALEREAAGREAVVVADECRATGGGIADAVLAHLAEKGFPGRLRSVRSADCFVPLGPAARSVLLGTRDIARAVKEVARR